MEKMQAMFNKDLEELKNKQSVMNNTINEMKNTLEELATGRKKTLQMKKRQESINYRKIY